jgi:flagellar biosynthesis anti-sigma factor FlgM
MRIQGPPAVNAVESTVPTTRAAAADSSNAETVSVSLRAQQISSTQASSQAARAAKLASLKQSVANGSYKVDTQQLSTRMADEELDRAQAGMSS